MSLVTQSPPGRRTVTKVTRSVQCTCLLDYGVGRYVTRDICDSAKWQGNCVVTNVTKYTLFNMTVHCHIYRLLFLGAGLVDIMTAENRGKWTVYVTAVALTMHECVLAGLKNLEPFLNSKLDGSKTILLNLDQSFAIFVIERYQWVLENNLRREILRTTRSI